MDVEVLNFLFSVTSLYSSGGHSNMAAVGFSFPTIDARSSPIFEISAFGPSLFIFRARISVFLGFGLVLWLVLLGLFFGAGKG